MSLALPEADELVGCQVPRIELVPPAAITSAGDDALELARLAGMDPDPWQCRVLQGALGQNERGHWTASEVGLVVGRQNGKGGCIEVATLNGLYLRDAKIVYTAHLMATSRKIRERIQYLIECVPDFDKEVKQIRTSNEEQSIVLKSGARIDFVARTGSSARGWAGYDIIFFDEAFALTVDMVGAVMPILFARQNWQIWYASMGGKANSDPLRQVRIRAINREPDLAYFEWSVDEAYWEAPEYISNMPAAWAQANPALGIRKGARMMTVQTIRKAQRSMAPAEFGREVLCAWDDPGGMLLIPVALWQRLIDPDSQISSGMVMSLDCSPGLASGCIGVAGYRPDGIAHVEITSRDGVLDHRAGAEWIPDRVKQLDEQWRPAAWLMDASGPARALLTDLARVGVEPVLLPSRELGAACGAMLVAATSANGDRLRHLGQPALLEAIKAARKRDSVDTWIWSRRSSEQDISPLMVATMGLYGLAVYDVQMYDPAGSVH